MGQLLKGGVAEKSLRTTELEAHFIKLNRGQQVRILSELPIQI